MSNKSVDKILLNLAALNLIEFCQRNNIPANGTHTVKNRRGINGKQFYSLVSNETGRAIVTVTLHESQAPTHTIHTR